MSVDINKFRSLGIQNAQVNQFDTEVYFGDWPKHLSGHVFLVGSFPRPLDRHLFVGEGLIVRWDLKAENSQIKVSRNKLDTWDSFWREIYPINFFKGFFPAVLSPIGVSEIANTAVVNMNGRLILTADAGRYWEVNPVTLKTITPIGYFEEHVVSIPISFFPLVANTAHPVYVPKLENPEEKELITCELKSKPRPGKITRDMVSDVYIIRWDGESELIHRKLEGVELDGTPHTTIVTEKFILIPDMPFQMGVAMLLGLNTPPQEAYPRTQIYIASREALVESKTENSTLPSRLITFSGDSYHFLCNYYHIDDEITLVAIQQATISVADAIKPGDVKHFNGESYSLDSKYFGIPWMFAFDPGVLRKVKITEDLVIKEETFIHPGWFSTTLYTADSREFNDKKGYSAIYQVYVGYHRDFISRRQYLTFRNHRNRILQDEQLPKQDLPSVLAKIPLDLDWDQLTAKIKIEQQENHQIHVSHLGQELLDFWVLDDDSVFDSIQFIPQDAGYIFVTVIKPKNQQDEAWLFASDNLKQGPIAKLRLPHNIQLGYTLHSEYFDNISPRTSTYTVDRLKSALGSITKVPQEFLLDLYEQFFKQK